MAAGATLRAVSVLWLVAAVSPAAQQTAKPPSSREALRTLSGSVVAAENDAALARVRVAVTAGTRPVDPIFTDDDGRFVVSVPPAASFTVAVTKAGYAQTAAVISAANASRPLRVRLMRSASISGRIVGPAGVPLLAARVMARRLDAGNLDAGNVVSSGSPSPFSAVTDDLGEYRLGGLPAGRYEVSAPGSVLSPEAMARLSQVGSSEFGRAVERTVQARRGTIVTDASRPPSGAVQIVAVQPGQEATSVDFVVEENGREVGADGWAPVFALRNALESARAPTPGRTGVIRGRVVTASGAPVVAADVRLAGVDKAGPVLVETKQLYVVTSSGRGFTGEWGTGMAAQAGVRTDAEGRFAFERLAPADYTLGDR